MTRRLVCSIAMYLTFVAACDRRTQAPDIDHSHAGTAAPKTVRAAGEGVTLTVTADRDRVRFEDSVDLHILVVARSDVVVNFDDYALALDRQPFGYTHRLLSSADAVPAADGTRRWTRDYRLTFLVPGEHQLPPVTLSYTIVPRPAGGTSVNDGEDQKNGPGRHDVPADSAGVATESKTLATDPLIIHVEATEQLDIPQDQLGQLQSPVPVALPSPSMSRWWPWATVAVLAVLGALVWWLMARRRLEPLEPPVPPHVWAERELQRLLAENLLELGRVQEFYFRLSHIVRVFTERRFGLSAPEMTTEEFLQAAMTGEVLGEANKRSLGEFLTACDLVKFALHVPDTRANREAIEKARDYIRTMSTEAADGDRSTPSSSATDSAGADR